MNRRTFLTLERTARRAHDQRAPMGRTAADVSETTSTSMTTDPLEPFVPGVHGEWDYTTAGHLLRRCMIGPTDPEIRWAVAVGLDATLEMLLTPFEPSTGMIERWAGRDPWVVSPPEGPEYDAWFTDKVTRRDELAKWWLKVIADSPVSFQESMTLFWHDHLPSSLTKVDFPEFLYVQNRLFRRHALGNFRQLIRDITVDMAMLIYLDGTANNRYQLNENYARELMELFTMGRVDRNGNLNYSQGDVVAAARSLTGWKLGPSPDGPEYHSVTSMFDSDLWDPGAKTFLGRRGFWGAMDVVDIIFAERADQVSTFICEKLYRALVYDAPDHSVVAEMARTFRENDWELRPVVRRLLTSAHFFDSQTIGALHKSHIYFFVSLIRGIGLGNVPDFEPGNRSPYHDLSRHLRGIGHLMFYPPGVDGWPGGRNWTTSSTLPTRQWFATGVAEETIRPIVPSFDWVRRFTFDAMKFAASLSTLDEPREICRSFVRFFLSRPLSSDREERLYDALLDGGPEYEWDPGDPGQRVESRIRKLLSAIVRIPEFQLY